MGVWSRWCCLPRRGLQSQSEARSRKPHTKVGFCGVRTRKWLRGKDLNLRPLGYEGNYVYCFQQLGGIDGNAKRLRTLERYMVSVPDLSLEAPDSKSLFRSVAHGMPFSHRVALDHITYLYPITSARIIFAYSRTAKRQLRNETDTRTDTRRFIHVSDDGSESTQRHPKTAP